MQIPVLVERDPGKGYRAKGVEPFNITAEGSTREEALRRLAELIAHHIAAGAEIVSLDLPTTEHPWAPFAGTLKDEPLAEAWEQAMAEYRRNIEADLEAP
jgi:predicted RNase H-like HicB family nuclease